MFLIQIFPSKKIAKEAIEFLRGFHPYKTPYPREAFILRAQSNGLGDMTYEVYFSQKKYAATHHPDFFVKPSIKLMRGHAESWARIRSGWRSGL